MAKKFKELRAKMSTSRQQRNKADADRLAKRMDEVSKTTKTTCTQLRCACGKVWDVDLPAVAANEAEAASGYEIQVQACPMCTKTRPGAPVGFSIGSAPGGLPGGFFALVMGGGEVVTAKDEPDG